MSEGSTLSLRTALAETVRSPPQTALFGTALLLVIIGPLMPRVAADLLLGETPVWVWVGQFALTLTVTGLAFLTDGFRKLRTVSIGVLTVLLTRLYFEVGAPDTVLGIEIVSPWSTVLDESIQLLIALGALVILFRLGYRRSDLFMRAGSPSRSCEPTWVVGLRTERSWYRAGVAVGVLLLGPLVLFLLAGGATYEFGTYPPTELAVLVPVILVVAAMNAFTEEAIFRAIPAAELTEAVGKSAALFLMSAFFGLAHYYGTPGGPLGVLMTGFLAWMLAKSMLETRGIAVAFVIHWLLDIAIIAAFLT